MKRFIVSVLCLSVFFTGLGGLIERVDANFKSDEKALALIAKARQAIGGEAAVSNVRSLTILGKATKTHEIDGVAQTEQGDLEINLELPNKMSKMLKLGDAENGAGNGQIVDKRFDVVVAGKGEGDQLQFRVEAPEGSTGTAQKFIIKKKDGTTEEVMTEGRQPFIVRKSDDPNASTDGNKVFVRKEADVLAGANNFHQNELVRTTLSLLLTAPEGLDVSYTYAGEGSVDGASCDIINAQVGGSSIKLYLDKSTALPRMMSYQGVKPFMIKIEKADAKADTNGNVKVFERKAPLPETVEIQVKFSDYRSVNGLQLPFRWTQTISGKSDETIDITSFEINPANISKKFKQLPRQPMVRMKKEH